MSRAGGPSPPERAGEGPARGRVRLDGVVTNRRETSMNQVPERPMTRHASWEFLNKLGFLLLS